MHAGHSLSADAEDDDSLTLAGIGQQWGGTAVEVYRSTRVAQSSFATALQQETEDPDDM